MERGSSTSFVKRSDGGLTGSLCISRFVIKRARTIDESSTGLPEVSMKGQGIPSPFLVLEQMVPTPAKHIAHYNRIAIRRREHLYRHSEYFADKGLVTYKLPRRVRLEVRVATVTAYHRGRVEPFSRCFGSFLTIHHGRAH